MSTLGFLYNYIFPDEFSIRNLIISFILLIFTAKALPDNPHLFGHYFIWFHAFFNTIPLFVYFTFSGGDIIYLLVCLFCFFLFKLFLSTPRVSCCWSVKFPFPVHFTWSAVVAIVLFIAYMGSYSLSFSFSEDIYAKRNEISQGQHYLFEYLHTILSKCLLPFLLLYYCVRKQKFLLLLVFLLSLLSFLLSMHRATLFIPFLVLFTYAILRLARLYGSWFIAFGFCFISLTCLVFLSFDSFSLIGDLLIRRTFITPACLGYIYHDYFSFHDFVYFSDSKISLGLIPSTYNQQVPHIIADYIGLINGHANIGYIGSGYQQFGYIGILIYIFTTVTFIKFIESININKFNTEFSFSLCSPCLLWLINSSDLPSVFFTHGLILLSIYIILSQNFLIQMKNPKYVRL